MFQNQSIATADGQRWIWWRKHSHPYTHVRLLYNAAFSDDHLRALSRVTTLTLASSLRFAANGPPPPQPTIADHRRCCSVSFLYDSRTLPAPLHKHVLNVLRRAGRVVRDPLPRPFRVWRSKYVMPTDPFEKAAYLIHFDQHQAFANKILQNPSLAHARSWVNIPISMLIKILRNNVNISIFHVLCTSLHIMFMFCGLSI